VVGQRITDVIVFDGRTDGENVRQLLAAREETHLDAGADRPTDAARHQRPHRVRDRRQGIARANDLAPQTRGFDPVARVGERGPNGSAQSGGRGRASAQVDTGP
jgi:hypothetical protein